MGEEEKGFYSPLPSPFIPLFARSSVKYLDKRARKRLLRRLPQYSHFVNDCNILSRTAGLHQAVTRFVLRPL